MSAGWWLAGNNQGGIHVAWGMSIGHARASMRKSIAETYAGEGLSRSDCVKAAYSYQLRLVAGPLTLKEAQEARRAWDNEDWELALRHARRHVRQAYGLAPRQKRPDG